MNKFGLIFGGGGNVIDPSILVNTIIPLTKVEGIINDDRTERVVLDIKEDDTHYQIIINKQNGTYSFGFGDDNENLETNFNKEEIIKKINTYMLNDEQDIISISGYNSNGIRIYYYEQVNNYQVNNYQVNNNFGKKRNTFTSTFGTC